MGITEQELTEHQFQDAVEEREKERMWSMKIEDVIIGLIVEYLCTNHTETELREIVDKAIKYANGERSVK